MTKRNKTLLLTSAALLCGVMGWHSERVISVSRARIIGTQAPSRETPCVTDDLTTRGVEAPRPTRSEALQFVRALYRKEQLTRELDLEQRRYGRNYWESARVGRRELQQLQCDRESMLSQLAAEANAVLRDLFPGETGEPVVLTALFDREHAGPNVGFLSAAERERFEAEILAADGEGGVDAERLRGVAERVLSSADIDLYRKWNDASAAALRVQLVGFDQTEDEFLVLLRDAHSAANDGEVADTGALAAALGAERFTELQRLKQPSLQAALNDLQRLGLPLDQAEWLAATRTRAVADIGEIWQSATLTDVMKRARVAQLERLYGQAIAVKLGLPDAALDGIEPNS